MFQFSQIVHNVNTFIYLDSISRRKKYHFLADISSKGQGGNLSAKKKQVIFYTITNQTRHLKTKYPPDASFKNQIP